MKSFETLAYVSASGALTAPGQLVLGRYRALERLGAGGFGVVWSAWDEQLGREVALKRIAASGAGTGADGGRGAREAVVTARLAHPAIVALYEARAEGDAFYLVSELVRGCTLAELCAERPPSDAQLLAIGVDLADALAHAHARGVIHRDLKPQNVLVPARPEPAAAKLCDFGGAHLAGEQALTRSGDVIGTLAYMAPEQAEGGAVSRATDVYALALLLYEALSGVHPVRGLTPAATARRLGQRHPRLSRHRPDLPASLCEVLDGALYSHPADRPELADVLAELELAHCAAAPDTRRLGGPERVDAAQASACTRVLGLGDACPRVERAPRPRRARRPGGRSAVGRRVAAPPEPQDSSEPSGAGPEHSTVSGSRTPLERRGFSPVARVLGGLSAGALVAVALSADAGTDIAAGARPVLLAAVALAVTLLPRLAWLACLAGVAGWLTARGHAGLAVVVTAAALPCPVLLRRGGPAWSVPALAATLGLVGLAGVYPALAGQARGWVRRAALGGLGFWWLTLVEARRGTRLWLGAPLSVSPADAWDGSPAAAVLHLVAPLLNASVLAGAGVWAVVAAALPWLVRGRSFGLDAVGAAAWASATVAATVALPEPLRGLASAPWPRGLLAGAALAAALSVGARALRGVA